MTLHDFRSDTVTLPTAEMMAAIATAPLGDAARGNDPTVRALERRGAELTGKAEALFVPSGQMANLAALLAHGCAGGEVIVEADAHIYNSEGGALSALAGAIPRSIRGDQGVMDPAMVEVAIRGGTDLALAPTRLICLENTHNASGGTVLPIAHLQAIAAVARRHGLPVHMDGARLFNAAAFLGVPILDLCRHVDTVWFSVCKGVGAPVGAVLAGDATFMRRAQRAAKMLGGGMRQAGLIAAPALVGLEDPYPQHRRDHDVARCLAEGLAAIDASLVDVDRVQTNIVNCWVDRFAPDAMAINAAFRARGILANAKRTKIRFVTHRDLAPQAVEDAIAAARDVFGAARQAA